MRPKNQMQEEKSKKTGDKRKKKKIKKTVVKEGTCVFCFVFFFVSKKFLNGNMSDSK